MPTDYRGPMRQGVTWEPERSWQDRYNDHLSKLDRMETLMHDLQDRSTRLTIDLCATPDRSRSEYMLAQALDRNKARIQALERQITDLKIHIRAIQNGYREP